MKRFTVQLLASAFLAFLFASLHVPVARAQTITGTILGTIRDSQGAVIPNASVSAKNRDTGAERTAVSDGSGGFSITSVPAGVYDVSASSAGFQQNVRSGVTMTVGASLRVDFSLTVGEVQQQVVVTGEAPQVDTTTSTLSGLVSDQTIRELPLNGRDWLQLGALQAGVLIGLSKNPDLGENVTHGGGMFMSISGGRPTSNVFMVDGLVINDMANKSPGSALGVNLGVDAIKEFSVLTSTYSAEFGRSSGGVINSITKSGTNTIHGTAFYFGRNSALDARNFFDQQIPPFRRHQFGGAIGGPIKKDKLFYFANYEGLRQFLSESFTSNTISNNARNGIICANAACTTTNAITINPRVKPYLPFYPVPNGRINGDVGQYVFGAGQLGVENYVLGRVDYLLSTNTTINGSYMFDKSNASTPDVFNNKLVGDNGRNQRITISVQHTFSPTVLNTVNLGLARTLGTGNIDSQPNLAAMTDKSLGYFPGQNAGTLTVAGLDIPGGLGATGGDQLWWTVPQLTDNLVWVKGRNNIRIGFSAEGIRDNIDVGHNPLGDWQFNSIQDLLTGTSAQFGAAVPGLGTYRGVREKIFGAYFQDDVRLRPTLTVNLGVRYEPTTTFSEVNGLAASLRHLSDAQIGTGNPIFQNPTMHDFSPRVGLAWDPTGSGKTSVRAGFGMFNVLPLPNLLSGNINHTVPFNLNAIVQNPPVATFPNQILPLLASGAGSGYYMEQNPPEAYKLQWNLNIERQITSGLSLTAGYVGSRGVHLPIRYGDVNLATPLATTSPGGNLLFPATGPIQKVNPKFPLIPGTLWNGYSIYHSLQFNATQRFSHGFSFQGVYVWSKNIDVGSSEVNQNDNFNNVDNPYGFKPNLERGVADWDVPHHLALNFVWDTPNPSTKNVVPRFLLSGWELSGIFTAQSGMPFSAKIQADQARTGTAAGASNGQRPNYIAGPGCSPNAVNQGNPNTYVKLQCFAFPALGQLGNSGRNIMRAPGLEDFDFSLFKNHNLMGEKLKVQFRMEAFNLFNRTNFGARWLFAFNGKGVPLPANTALKAPTVTTSRQIQFGLKFLW